MKDADAAKHIAKINGRGSRPRFAEAASVIGVMMIAVAAFEETSVKIIASTGSPLSKESFVYVYKKIKKDVHLSSFSGGTDIVSCFVLGNLFQPVYAGEIQNKGLGMDVDIFDEKGFSIQNTKGELVCKKPFPSMPIKFWNDEGDKKYKAAYFEKYKKYKY